jgi:hypothetical protein
MIIDLILDRKNGVQYDARQFYNGVMSYIDTMPEIATPIADALDGGTEEQVKNALKEYILNEGYNTGILNYIDSAPWV